MNGGKNIPRQQQQLQHQRLLRLPCVSFAAKQVSSISLQVERLPVKTSVPQICCKSGSSMCEYRLQCNLLQVTLHGIIQAHAYLVAIVLVSGVPSKGGSFTELLAQEQGSKIKYQPGELLQPSEYLKKMGTGLREPPAFSGKVALLSHNGCCIGSAIAFQSLCAEGKSAWMRRRRNNGNEALSESC